MYHISKLFSEVINSIAFTKTGSKFKKAKIKIF